MARTGVGRAGAKWTYGTVPGTGIAGFRIDGIENVTAGINRALLQIKAKSAAGLMAAAEHVLEDADSGTPPLVPQDTGELRESTFKKPFNNNIGDPFVVLGYDTDYAAAVHEMLASPSGKPINWQREGSGPRFLEASLKRNSENVVRIVAKHARK